MLLPTMTYEEIYQAIDTDMPEVWNVMQKHKHEWDRKAKRAPKMPYKATLPIKHPTSHNQYIAYLQINKHSAWEHPFICFVCQYDGKYGKDSVGITIFQDHLLLHFFTPHYWKRYKERFLGEEFSLNEAMFIHMSRNPGISLMGPEYVSQAEKEKDISPDFQHQSFLLRDGLALGLQHKTNHYILVYKTYLTIQDLWEGQYKAVYDNLIHMMYIRALTEEPRFKESITKIYIDGINQINSYQEDKSLSIETANDLSIKAYENTLKKLDEYIIY